MGLLAELSVAIQSKLTHGILLSHALWISVSILLHSKIESL